MQVFLKCLFILPTCVFIYLLIYLFAYLFVYLFIYLVNYLFAYLFTYLFIFYLSVADNKLRTISFQVIFQVISGYFISGY